MDVAHVVNMMQVIMKALKCISLGSSDHHMYSLIESTNSGFQALFFTLPEEPGYELYIAQREYKSTKMAMFMFQVKFVCSKYGSLFMTLTCMLYALNSSRE